ncbi:MULTISPECIES: phosphotransferase [Pandoraea]|uniref:phosphotransferase n=1 Tax=Pandoraea TaxID=93217 RepID=UPI001F5CF1EE|nr:MULTISPECIES: phosphotransferase [Pandoraea]MCI3204759.1 phosphotransferase family protein [Pandoraea sp. LA3]MDN4582787.1 phosphotransferase family protein [Pandoraea capi]
MAEELVQDFSAFAGERTLGDRIPFDAAALERWLTTYVDGYAGPLVITQFNGGQSNPTYRLTTPAAAYVLRTKPAPAARLLPSAHAIEREYRVMDALSRTDVPVARMRGLCEDESVIGLAFYVMDFVDGRVLWDPSLPGMTSTARSEIYDEMNRVIAALHRVDYRAVGLESYGKPGDYMARQIARWSKQYRASETDTIDAMDRLIDWLPAHLPAVTASAPERTTLVHGDFRLDNLIFHPSEPRVLAVLDWELSTLGDPLADFSYHCMAWHVSPGVFRGIAGLDWPALGIPDDADYIRRYSERTGSVPPAQWDFYLAYNMFRIAAILQGIMKRVSDGTAASAQALDAGKRARPMAELAWAYAQRAEGRDSH